MAKLVRTQGPHNDNHYPVTENGIPIPKSETCGVCQRPWVGGKCSGGFINHKL